MLRKDELIIPSSTGHLPEKTHREACLQLALARMTDVGAASRHALAEEGGIISDLSVGADPAKALSRTAEDDVRSPRAELRRLRGSS